MHQFLALKLPATVYRYHPQTGADAEEIDTTEWSDEQRGILAEHRSRGGEFYWVSCCGGIHFKRVCTLDIPAQLLSYGAILFDKHTRPPPLETDPAREEIHTGITVRVGAQNIDVGQLTRDSFQQWLVMDEDGRERKLETLAFLMLGHMPPPADEVFEVRQDSGARH